MTLTGAAAGPTACPISPWTASLVAKWAPRTMVVRERRVEPATWPKSRASSGCTTPSCPGKADRGRDGRQWTCPLPAVTDSASVSCPAEVAGIAAANWVS